MLGAQALRTKQKAEQKEKEKRHKERQRNLELQRERIHKAAQEDAAQALLEAAAHNPGIVATLPPQAPRAIQQRHSVYVTGLNGHLIPAARRSDDKMIPQRSPSSDYGRVSSKERRQSNGTSGGNRLMKWLGLSNGVDHHKDKEKRRMSTF